MKNNRCPQSDAPIKGFLDFELGYVTLKNLCTFYRCSWATA